MAARIGGHAARERSAAKVSVASTIAIDGPAGSGKTVVGHAVAERLDYLFLDTGAMYRALTYLAIQRGLDPSAGSALAALARQTVIDVLPDGPADGRPYTVLADGADVTWAIRQNDVTQAVSAVSAHAAVRTEMVAAQRRIAGRGRCVLSGRDIGAVVLPNADLKIFLTASLDERARRRTNELRAQGRDSSFDDIRADLERRDRLDSEREVSPLEIAAGARVVDSTRMSLEEVIAHVIALATGNERVGGERVTQ